jgi:hypothetical protein
VNFMFCSGEEREKIRVLPGRGADRLCLVSTDYFGDHRVDCLGVPDLREMLLKSS